MVKSAKSASIFRRAARSASTSARAEAICSLSSSISRNNVRRSDALMGIFCSCARACCTAASAAATCLRLAATDASPTCSLVLYCSASWTATAPVLARGAYLLVSICICRSSASQRARSAWLAARVASACLTCPGASVSAWFS